MIISYHDRHKCQDGHEMQNVGYPVLNVYNLLLFQWQGVQLIFPLKLLKMAIFLVSFPIENDDFP